MALQQNLQQKLLQKLSPQQIQLMKLLQLPTMQLEERIKEELEENPALEVREEDGDGEYRDEFESSGDQDTEPDGSEEEYQDIDISDYVQDEDDETPDYKTREDFSPEMDEKGFLPHRVEVSFHETMVRQLGVLKLSRIDRKIAEQVIGSLDDDGYLRREITSIMDDLAFRQNLDVSEKQIESIIHLVQQFDPPGVCARDLQECLLLQLKRKQEEGDDVSNAVRIIRDYFDEFSKKHYDRIQKSLQLDEASLRTIIHQIVRLNPRPGIQAVEVNPAEQYIVPDFFVFNNNGKLDLTLNSRNAPDLRVSEAYKDMLRGYEKTEKPDRRQKEAVMFIKQKLDSAKWFIDAIKQRQDTLLHTMEAILHYQKSFFLSGDETELRPMILKDIAEQTGLDISTISRVANSKFVQTEFGTFRLKFFFSEGLQTESGEEVSTREVKKILLDFIENENKKNPLSDEALTELLLEKGYNIARRTVAKYREQLNIPVARLRKNV
jgi:RNA polymerase sigma-54 factor